MISLSIYYNNLSLFCPSVWPVIDSAPEHHTDLRLVPLEPVWLKSAQRKKKFARKMTSGQITEQKVKPIIICCENFLLY
jgi:hypothetical protein